MLRAGYCFCISSFDWILDKVVTYFDEEGVIGAVGRVAAVAGRRILPVEIEAVEFVLAQVADGRFDEIVTHVGIGHKFGEAVGRFVPAADGQQRFQLLVVSLQSVEFGVSACTPSRKYAHLFIQKSIDYIIHQEFHRFHELIH